MSIKTFAFEPIGINIRRREKRRNERKKTYALQVAMCYFARVEEVKAVCHIPQLWYLKVRAGLQRWKRFAYQANAIYGWVLFHKFGNCAIFHPIENDFERWRYLGRYSEKRHNVWMLQPLPDDNFSIKYLLVSDSLVTDSRGERQMNEPCL